MKTILLINILLLAFATNAISQQCSSNNIQSPVVQKPTAANASVTCNSIAIQWQGNADETYRLNVTVKDAVSGKVIKTFTTDYKQNNGNYSASVAVTAGTKISWNVQGLKVINQRTFTSYPARGSKDYVVPKCESTIAAASDTNKENAVIATDKLEIKLFPDPVQSTLNLEFSGTKIPQKKIQVFDTYGRAIISERHDHQNNIQINVTHLIAGAYVLRVTDATGKTLFTGKFIKQ
jgi:hypothetical protein